MATEAAALTPAMQQTVLQSLLRTSLNDAKAIGASAMVAVAVLADGQTVTAFHGITPGRIGPFLREMARQFDRAGAVHLEV